MGQAAALGEGLISALLWINEWSQYWGACTRDNKPHITVTTGTGQCSI